MIIRTFGIILYFEGTEPTKEHCLAKRLKELAFSLALPRALESSAEQVLDGGSLPIYLSRAHRATLYILVLMARLLPIGTIHRFRNCVLPLPSQYL